MPAARTKVGSADFFRVRAEPIAIGCELGRYYEQLKT